MLLTETALAEKLNVQKATVRRWRLLEKLPFLKTGHRYYYRLEVVVQWIKEKEADAQAAIQGNLCSLLPSESSI